MAARSECVDRAPCLAELYDPHACRLAFLSVPSSARPSYRLHFEVRLLNIIPPNGAHVFLVRRVDGTDAWVRPQHRAVGFGRLENLFPPEALAAPRGMPSYRFEPAAMLADPSPDISRATIIAFLCEQRHHLRVVLARSETSTQGQATCPQTALQFSWIGKHDIDDIATL